MVVVTGWSSSHIMVILSYGRSLGPLPTSGTLGVVSTRRLYVAPELPTVSPAVEFKELK
jgi:hypothetical protein